MQALQKKQKTWVLLLLGALLGLAAFLCLYGTAPLDPANDAWIWYGYDETDIHQHYAGWLGFRNSSWQFPLAQADALAYPAGTGVNISFTDSLPWVSVLFKLLAPVLPAQFQWFGLYELAAFILQGMAAALFLYDLLPLAAGTALFAFSPIMIERAFRHVALSSHYIVLFALYTYLRGRREQRCFMPVFWLLAALGVGITPYFLPMAAIFALLLAVENALHTRKLLAPCGLFLGTCAAGYAAGVVLGSLNNGYSASRENYGVFSFNLNALFNPSSVGGYTWSRILPARPQLYGQYDGFNYLGFGILALLGVLCAAAVVLAVHSKAGRAALAGLLRRNLVLILGMAFMTLFAITNVVCFDDVELLNIPLPEGLVKLCGIFRASGRMFYPVYYVLMTACIVGLARLLRRPLRLDVIERTCIIYTNAGILVIPLVRALLGEDYVIYSCAFLVVQQVLLWTHCRSLLCGTRGFAWKKIIGNVNIIAILIGGALFILRLPLPGLVNDLFSQLGAMVGPIGMLLAGIVIADTPLRQLFMRRRHYVPVLLRLIICPIITVLLLRVIGAASWIPDGHSILLTVYLACITPACATVTSMAQLYDRDAEYSSALYVLTTLFSILTMPLMVWVFEALI